MIYQVVLLQSMQKLTNIIIRRLKDVRDLNAFRSDSLSQSQINIAIPASSNQRKENKRGHHDYRKRQTQRLLEEIHLIEPLQNEDLSFSEVQFTLVKVSRVVVGVLNLYNSSMMNEKKEKIKMLKNSGPHEVCQALCHFFRQFLEEQQYAEMCLPLLKELKRKTDKIEPYDFILWLGQWSKILFKASLNLSPTGRTRKVVKSTIVPQSNVQPIFTSRPIKTEQSVMVRPSSYNPSRTMFFSREYLYSFFKTEISAVYELHQDCLNLDQEYLGRIAKAPKKIEFEVLMINAVGFLSKNGSNNIILNQIEKYRDQWRTKVPGFAQKERQMQRELKLSMKKDQIFLRNESKTYKLKTSNGYQDQKGRQRLMNQNSKKKPETKIRDEIASAKKTANVRRIQSKQNNTFFKTSSSFFPDSQIPSKTLKSYVSEVHQSSNPQKKEVVDLNFIRTRNKAKKRNIYKEMNSTFTVCFSHQQQNFKSKSFVKPVQKEELSSSVAKEKSTNPHVFILDYDESSNVSKLNWQELMLKAKRSMMMIARGALLLGSTNRQ